MKILLVNDYATPVGGAEVQTIDLRDELRARGHDARLFASSAASSASTAPPDFECLGTTSRYRTVLQSANPWAYCRLASVLARFKPDVVHVTLFLTQLSPLILPLLRAVPSLYYVVWYRPICPKGTKLLPDGSPCNVRWGSACHHHRCLPTRDWLPLMLQMKLWWRWRHAFDAVVADSEAVRKRLFADGIVPSEVIIHGVPTRSARPPLPERPTVAFAGRLVREKGADVLIESFAKALQHVPAARLLIAGDGPEREPLRRLCRRLGIDDRVVMSGSLSRADVERTFDSAWVQAVPSRWEEPFGMVAAEAMMRGSALVASDAGGLREIVSHGSTGFLVPPGDVAALTAALVKLLGDRTLAEDMGRAGRVIALEKFSLGAHADRFIRLYGELVKKRTDDT